MALNLWNRFSGAIASLHVIHDDKTFKCSRGDVLYLLFSLFYCLRLIAFSLAIRYDFKVYFTVDRFFAEFFLPMQFDSLMYLFGALLMIGTFSFYYLLYMLPQVYIWSLANQMVVLNSQQFFTCNPQYAVHLEACRSRLTRYSALSIGKEIRRAYREIESGQEAVFRHDKLPMMGDISSAIRIKLAYQTFSINTSHGTLLLLYSLLFLFVGVCFTIILHLRHYSPLSIALLQVDLLGLAYLYWSSFETAQFAVYYMKILSVLCCSHLKHLNALLASLVADRRSASIGRQWYLSVKLSFFAREHTKIVGLTRRSNEFASKALTCAAIADLSFSVYMLTMWLFKEMTFLARLLSAMLLIDQTCGFLLAILPMVAITGQIHRSARYLTAAQQIMRPPFQRRKLRILATYELVNSKRKVVYTIGALGKVTKMSMFNFALYYINILLMSIRFYFNY